MGNNRKIADIGSITIDVSGYLYYNADSSVWHIKYDASLSSGGGDVTKAYVDGSISAIYSQINKTDTSLYNTYTNAQIDSSFAFKLGFQKITVGTTQPASPATGDIWFDTN